MQFDETYNSPFPDEFVPPSEKLKKEWALQVAKAIYDFRGRGPSFLANDRGQHETNREYYRGQQVIRNKNMIVGSDSAEESFMPHMRYEIVNYAKKVIDALVSKIGREYDPVVSTIDPVAKARRLQQKLIAKLNGIRKKEGAPPVGAAPQSGFEGTDEELEMLEMMDAKEASCIELEMEMASWLDFNRYTEIKKQRNLDIALTGTGIQLVYMDPAGNVRIERIDPSYFFTNFPETPDYHNMKYAGHIEWWSVDELFYYAKDEMPLDEIRKIASNYNSRTTYRDYYRNGSPVTDRHENMSKIPVLYYEYKTVDTDFYKHKQNKHGNPDLVKPDRPGEIRKLYTEGGKEQMEKEKGYKIVKDAYETVYCGWYILNSEHVIRWGKKRHIAYYRGNYNQTSLSYKAYSPGMYNNRVVSVMDVMRPILNELYEVDLKQRQMLYAAVPKGVFIDPDALMEANIALKGNSVSTPAQLLNLYYERGVMVGRMRQMDGMGSPTIPIQEMENGLARDFVVLTNRISELLIRLEDITGLTKSVIGGAMHQNKGKAVAEMEAMGSETVLESLYHADRYIDRETFSTLGELVVQRRKHEHHKPFYEENFGWSGLVLFNDKDEVGQHGRQFVFNIEARPTNQEWQKLYELVGEAVAKGELTTEDRIMLEKFKNYKQAMMYLRYKTRKNIEMMQKSKQQDMQMNAQVQQQSLQQKAMMEMELEKLKFQHEKELKILEMEIEQRKLKSQEQNTEKSLYTKILTNHEALGAQQQIAMFNAMSKEKEKEKDQTGSDK